MPILGVIHQPSLELGKECRDGALNTSIDIQEGFHAAFKPLGQASYKPGISQWAPGVQTGTSEFEAGYFAPGSNVEGGAVRGSRLLLRFFNIPVGVQLAIPKLVETADPATAGDGVRLQWVSGADANGDGGTVSSETNNIIVASPPNGFAAVTYEVLDSNPLVSESLAIPVQASWAAGATNVGSMQVKASLAPLSTALQADLVAPEPRFFDHGSAQTILTIAPCTSTLLFPMISNQGGDDTRIVIDNTTGIGATTPGVGACTVHYHGSTSGGGAAPPDQTSTPIPAGGRLEFTLAGGNMAQGMAGAPDLRGYAMAVCDFESAAGRATITRGGTRADVEAEQVAFDQGARVAGGGALLLPFVSARDGFDTEITLTNSTEDWLGTEPESGVCTVRYFGPNAPTPQLTPTIAAGEQMLLRLSQPAPDFEGYMTFDCGLSSARAVARLSKGAHYAMTVEAEPAPIADGPSMLLLPNATTREGHNTWLTLANKSADGLGSTPQAGHCAVRFHGDAASPAAPDQLIALAAGETARWRLSEGLPSKSFAPVSDFFGSIGVVCDFPRAAAAILTTEGIGAHARAAFAQVAERISTPRDTQPAPAIFPYVAHAGGFDSVLTLANTTGDPFGTMPFGGACNLSFHGQNAPAPATFTLAPNEHIHFRLSQGLAAKNIPGAPGFAGFAAADCNFPLARATDWRREDVTPLELSERIGVYSDGGAWRLDRNGDGAFQAGEAAQFGFPGAMPITGDWDGDGRDEIGAFANGFWFLDYDGNGQWDGGVADKQYQFGWAGVTPFVGDWNGDGRETIGIYIDGFWYLDADGSGTWDGECVDIAAHFGYPGVTPLVGDWSGDGRAKIGIYIDGFWYLDYDGSGHWDGPGADRQAHFGFAGVTPVTADWNGDGRAKIGLYYDGFWYEDYNGNGLWDGPVSDREGQFGYAGATPQTGDWTGAGRASIGIYDNGVWYLDLDADRTWDGGVADRSFTFGQPADTPANGRW